MLAHIFYSIGVLFIIRAISSIYHFKRNHSIKEWRAVYSIVIGKEPKDSDFRSKEELDIYQTNIAFNIVEITWLLIGLFSSNIYVFLIMILMFIVFNVFSKYFRFTIFEKTLSIIFLLIRFFVYLLLIVNDFTYQYNFFTILKNWI